MLKRYFFLALLMSIILSPVALSQVTDVLGKLAYSQAAITRPGDTLLYNAGDLVTGASPMFLRFKDVVKTKGASGEIEAIALMADTSQDDIQLNLTLFNDTTGIVLPLDNDSLKLAFADYSHLVARIQGFGLDSQDSSQVSCIYYAQNLPFICKTKDLYGIISVYSSFTPKALGNYRVALWIRRN